MLMKGMLRVEKEVVGTELEKEMVVTQGIAYSSLGSSS